MLLSVEIGRKQVRRGFNSRQVTLAKILSHSTSTHIYIYYLCLCLSIQLYIITTLISTKSFSNFLKVFPSRPVFDIYNNPFLQKQVQLFTTILNITISIYSVKRLSKKKIFKSILVASSVRTQNCSLPLRFLSHSTSSSR